MKKISLIIIFTWATLSAGAQNEGTLSLMNSLPQQMDINPAFVPKYKFSFTLPGFSAGAYYSNSGFTYDDLASKLRDTIIADLPKLRSNLKDKNYITQAVSVDLLRVSFRVNKKLFMSLGATAKGYNRVMLPKNIFDILIDGNVPSASAGSNLLISPQVESVSFLEGYVGGAYQINEALTVGVRAKLYKGVTNATTQQSALNITTDNSTYAITAAAGANIQTSGIYNLAQSGYSFNTSDYLKNTGLGLDIGATYKITDRITVAASILDIGSINWSNNTYGYTLDPSKAKYTFQGFDLSKLVNNEPNYVKSISDSIQKNFKFQEGAVSSYSSGVPSRMYFNGTFQITPTFTAGAVLFNEIFKGRTNLGLTFGVNKHFGQWVSVSGSYTVSNNSFNNLGAGISLNLPGVQLFLVGDNLLRAPLSGSQINSFINSSQLFNIRTGLNFVVGWKPGRKEGPASAADFKTKSTKKAVKATNSKSSDFRQKKKR